MGAFKPLLPLGDKPLLARVLETLQFTPQISPILVVVGHRKQEILPLLGVYKDVIAVENSHYAVGGMLSSIQAGVAALPAGALAFLLVLGDQPNIAPEAPLTLLQTAETEEATLFVPTYNGKRGHPVLFSAQCIPEILALEPPETLKTIVNRHSNTLREVPVHSQAILTDVDTPEDYAQALEVWRKTHKEDTLHAS
jgi:molybdenum cofactor cytidylyltransferase